MIACVCPTDSGRIEASLTSGFKLVGADTSSGCCITGRNCKIQSTRSVRKLIQKNKGFIYELTVISGITERGNRKYLNILKF